MANIYINKIYKTDKKFSLIAKKALLGWNKVLYQEE